MQTFLPFPCFFCSASVLDQRRLGKQRVEAKQIWNACQPNSTSRWRNHSAVRMWKPYVPALEFYHDVVVNEWVSRGYNNSMPLFDTTEFVLPHWLTADFCRRHRSNLLRKNPLHYLAFGWTDPWNLEYFWPM